MRIREFSPGDQVALTEEGVKSLTDKRMYGLSAGEAHHNDHHNYYRKRANP